MPRKRKPENRGLPARWRFVHNAYYYQVPPGQEHLWEGRQTFRLGKALHEAYKVWAARLDVTVKAQNIGQLLDRYSLEVIPTKAPATRIGNTHQLSKLRTVFATMPLGAVRPSHIYTYFSKSTAKVAARREIALLSHAYTKAVEWGYLDRHPFKGEVRLKGEKPRTRYVTDDEVLACLSLKPKRKGDGVKLMQAYIRLKLLTGLRRADLLQLELINIKEDGLHVTTSKTSRAIIYVWTNALRETIELVKAVRPTNNSTFLFCTRRGKSYHNKATGKCEGWKSIWQRFMDRVIAETDLKERFTEHDLRAKVASDATSLEHAQKLLAHADSRITQRVYRRKPDKVKPSK